MSAASVQVIGAICWRTWLKTFRRPVVLTFSFVQPLMWMLFFGFLFQRYQLEGLGEGVRYIDFLAPGVCTMTVLFGASQSGIGWIRDLQTGFLQRMLQTPASRTALLAGKILADVLRLLVQALVVVLLAFALGARLRPDFALLPLAILYAALFAASMSALSSFVALKARAQESMAVFVHLVNMPLLFTSTALVPHRDMPDWLAAISRWNPLTLTADGWRGALLTGEMPQLAATLGALALLAGAFFLLAARAMSRVARDT